MPELPDLQVFSENLKRKIEGKEIVSAELFREKRIDEPLEGIRSRLIGSRFTDIQRDGKELDFRLENGYHFSVHLMLSGKFRICETDQVAGIESKIMSIGFRDGQSLVITDRRSLCRIMFHPVPDHVPDALSSGFTFEYLRQRAAESGRRNIKAFLTDQAVVKGIGNAYADEILWKANISPESKTGKIPETRLMDLYQAVPSVLQDAILSIKREDPEITGGQKRNFLNVHNAEREFTDDGDRILMKKIASKTTYYTEKQELFQ